MIHRIGIFLASIWLLLWSPLLIYAWRYTAHPHVTAGWTIGVAVIAALIYAFFGGLAWIGNGFKS